MPVADASWMHRLFHNPQSTEPFPLELKESPGRGRFLVASRDIEAGQVVLRAEPYAAVPDSAHRLSHCLHCLNPVKDQFRACPGCQSVCYCSSDCASRDQDAHTALGECDFLRDTLLPDTRLTDYQKDYAWMLFRCLIRRLREPSQAQVTFQDVWRLCSNRQDFTAERQQEFQLIADVLLGFMKKHALIWNTDSFWTRDTLVELICKEECNSFGLYTFTRKNEPRQSYALALFPTAVYFNHSCAPNVVHTTEEGQNEVFYSARFIPKGEELNITYISIKQSHEERQRELKDVFLFQWYGSV